MCTLNNFNNSTCSNLDHNRLNSSSLSLRLTNILQISNSSSFNGVNEGQLIANRLVSIGHVISKEDVICEKHRHTYGLGYNFRSRTLCCNCGRSCDRSARYATIEQLSSLWYKNNGQIFAVGRKLCSSCRLNNRLPAFNADRDECLRILVGSRKFSEDHPDIIDCNVVDNAIEGTEGSVSSTREIRDIDFYVMTQTILLLTGKKRRMSWK